MHKDFELLKKYSASERTFEIVLKHGLEVLSKSIDIIKKKGIYHEVNFDLVISGSILHDIGTFEFLENQNKDGYIKHGIIGGEILRREGLEKEALIAERHTGSGISRKDIIANGFPLPHEDFLPISLEEKLVCYADKFSSKSGKMHTMEEVEEEFAKYGEEPYRRFCELRNIFE